METYSVINDFGGTVPDLSGLHSEIVENVGILKTLYGITYYDDVIDIEFDLTLSAGEKTVLDGIISGYVYSETKTTDLSIVIIPKTSSTKAKSYRRIAVYKFPATSYATANIVSYMDSTATSYDVELFDQTNHQILLQKNLTNTIESNQQLGELTNLPSESFLLEIHVKVNGSGKKNKVYIESININYD